MNNIAALAAQLAIALPFGGQGITVTNHSDAAVFGSPAVCESPTYGACVRRTDPHRIHCNVECDARLLLHEIGHVLDLGHLNDERRFRFAGYFGRDDYDPEWFAESYAACATRQPPLWYGVRLTPWTGKRGLRVCRAIAKWSAESVRVGWRR